MIRHTTNRFDLPALGYGMGLRAKHYPHVLEHRPEVDFFEVISENFIQSSGRPRRILSEVRERYPVIMHGVSMSIGTADPLNSEYLHKLKKLTEWLNPIWVSDHVCWTGVAHKNSHDLLPVPYTEEALAHLVGRIREVQDYLERPLILENPSTYLEFTDSTMPEWEFIARMAEEADCGLLLDINNVYVTCFNHRLNPKVWLDAMPMDRVVQIHLAGHCNKGTHIVDTHDGQVIEEVWALYRYVASRYPGIATMIEWDERIPEFDALLAETHKARDMAQSDAPLPKLPDFTVDAPRRIANAPAPLNARQELMQEAILAGARRDTRPGEWIHPKPGFSPAEQLYVYIGGYRARLFDIVNMDYPALRHYLGDEKTDALLRGFVDTVPSTYYDVSRYSGEFPPYLKQHAEGFAHDLCRLETAISLLFNAPDSDALDNPDVEGMDPDMLMESVLQPRAALELMRFDHPVNAYYQAYLDGKTLEETQEKACYLAVFRHDEVIWRLELEPAEYRLLALLFAGQEVGEALEVLLEEGVMTEDALLGALSGWFARWLRNHLLARPEMAVRQAA